MGSHSQADKKAYFADIPLEQWLAQFQTPEDRRLARILYDRLQFFDVEDLRQSAREMHDWLSQQPSVHLGRTAYIGLGKGKSGDYFRYLYRQANNLPEKNMINIEQLQEMRPNQKFDTLVLLDDFIGMGVSASTYIHRYWEQMAQYKRVFLLSPVGSAEGAAMLNERYPKMNIHFWRPCENIAGSGSSDVLADNKELLKAFLERYQQAVPVNPKGKQLPITSLGFGNLGALVVFEHNTPNNVPPIFWSYANGWRPIFPRHCPGNSANPPNFAGYYTSRLKLVS